MSLNALAPTDQIVPVQDTTLSKDALARFVCNTWDEATTDSLGIDVVVIGAGLFGGYCGSKIFELSRARFAKTDPARTKALRVLVLEAGPFLIPGHTQNIPNLGLFDPGIFNATSTGPGAPAETRNLVWGVGWRSNQPFVGQAYCIGGKGIFWGGWCPRLQPVDLKKWPAEVRNFLMTIDPTVPVGTRPIEHVDPDTGSILRRDDPLTGYEALEYEAGVAPTDDFVFDPVAIAQSSSKMGLNGALRIFLNKQKATIDTKITAILPAPIAVQTQSFVSGLFALDKYSSVPGLMACARADHADGREFDLRMSVVPLAHVVRLECVPSDETPVGTRSVNRIVVVNGGSTKTLEIGSHCQVVLAMSCIESTRLALESFSLESSGLRGPGDELMGRNFMFHLRADIAFRVERAKLAAFVAATWPGKTLAEVLQLASMHIQCESPNGTYQYQLYAATNDAGPDSDMYKMVPDLDIQRSIAAGFRSDKISFVLRSSGEVNGGKAATLRDPAFDYVDLAGMGDFDNEFGHRRAWVQFKTAADHTFDPIWKDMHDTAHAVARALANGGSLEYTPVNGNSDFSLPAFSRQQGVGTTFHDAGTLWMGDDPDGSVTDVNGRFHHVSNVYCADQAVFTTVGSANPALTGLCIARKVAGDIVARHDAFQAPAATLAGFQKMSLAKANGWRNTPYDGVIEVNGGAIIEVNPTSGIGIYYLPQLFADFELYVEWKAFRLPAFPNSGVLLRMPDPAGINFSDQSQFDKFYDSTVEVQIDELGKNFSRDRFPSAIFGDSRYKTGAIYGVATAKQWAATVLAPDGEVTAQRYWNYYHIKVVGSSVEVILNGKSVCQSNLPPNKPAQGFIGFQFHTGRVQFRNLQIKK